MEFTQGVLDELSSRRDYYLSALAVFVNFGVLIWMYCDGIGLGQRRILTG
ncbi:MAG: hypothetical protein HYR63_11425 [Proteobacteria bacterium]|nr:hypothetical protein [Pseudomonadota bacterium]MBI3496326.1 hypothetical protein [Pseudomonadota bacterium]